MTSKTIILIVMAISIIDTFFHFRAALKHDQQLSRSGESPLGRSTYYMIVANFFCLLAVGSLAYWLTPQITFTTWVAVLVAALSYLVLNYLSAFVETIFTFVATRRLSKHYERMEDKHND